MRLGPALIALLVLSTGVAGGQVPISIEEALREARANNARLPIPAYDVAIARGRLAEARAERWLRTAVEGDLVYAPPSGYDPAVTDAGEFRLQAVGRQPLYDVGARRAAINRAGADLAAAGGRYRIAEKDLDLEVVSQFNEMFAASEEVQTRRAGIARLESYRTSLKSRQASGAKARGARAKAVAKMVSLADPSGRLAGRDLRGH